MKLKIDLVGYFEENPDEFSKAITVLLTPSTFLDFANDDAINAVKELAEILEEGH